MKNKYRNRNNNFEDMKCIWMSSNHVEYKLCDMNFNCEKCAFDKVISNSDIQPVFRNKSESIEKNILEELSEKVLEATFPHNVTLLRNNLVLKNLFSNTYYLGISPVGSVILEDNADYKLLLESVNIKKDEPIIEFYGDWGNISITSPFNFHTLGNFKKSNKTKLDSWFCIVEADEEEIESAKISPQDYAVMISEVKDFLNKKEEIFSEVGLTMNDGGEQLEHLYQIIGKSEYNKLLKLIFKR